MAQSDQQYVYYPAIGIFLDSPERWAEHIGTEAERIIALQWASAQRKGNYLFFPSEQLKFFTEHFQHLKITERPWKSLGSSSNANSLGPLGYLLVSSDHALQTLESMAKHYEIISSLVTLRITKDSEYLNLEITPSPLLPRTFAENLAITMIQSMAQFGSKMSDNDWGMIKLDLACTEDPSILTLLEKDSDSCIFNSPSNRFRIPINTTQEPFPFANIDAQNMALTQINQLRQELQSARTLSAQITQMLSSAGNNFPTMESIADTLNVTSRTLQRRLSAEDTNFRELLNTVKIERAIYYMMKKNQPPKQVAYLVGFKDASSFTKAFKRYTGKTPSDYLLKNSV